MADFLDRIGRDIHPTHVEVSDNDLFMRYLREITPKCLRIGKPRYLGLAIRTNPKRPRNQIWFMEGTGHCVGAVLIYPEEPA